MNSRREEVVPPSRREFVPAPGHQGPADWRTALRWRAPRCGIGVALTLALVFAALWNAADGEKGCLLTESCDAGLSAWAVTWALGFVLSLLVAVALVTAVLRDRRRGTP